MRIDALQRLIESAGPSELRDLARICLQARGFVPVIADGPYEGSADILFFQHPTIAATYEVALSSTRDWEKKLRQDAARARAARPALARLLFVSSQRIPEGSFTRVADELRLKLGIEVTRMDSQGMASIAEQSHLTAEVLRVFGIRRTDIEPRKALQRKSLRQDLACACAFFGIQAGAFRDSVIENAVVGAVTAAGGEMGRAEMLAQVRLALGLSSNQERQIQSAVDRLLGRRVLVGKNGHLVIQQATADAWQTARALREHGFEELKGSVRGLLAEHLEAGDADIAADAVMEDLGALLLAGAGATSAVLGRNQETEKDAVLRDRLRRLQATLESAGMPAAARDQVMTSLVESASRSTFGVALLSGEIFLQLTQLGTEDFLRALGVHGDVYLVLDTSVAMPMLAALLYEATEQELFFAARALYDQLDAHRIQPLLPRPYLEEIASHLVTAAQAYAPIAGLDPDLRASKNMFVAHYAALRERGRATSYEGYLESFGLRPALANGDFFFARDIVMREIASIADQYGLRVIETTARRSHLDRARRGLEMAMDARRVERPYQADRAKTARDHDTDVLGWLLDPQGLGAPPGTKVVLCSWDKLLQAARASLGGAFDALDPLALCDALALSSPDDGEIPLFLSPLALARELSEEASMRGAEVWDQLVQIERGQLQDAEVRKMACAFKEDWLARAASSRRTTTLQEAWEAWKRAHPSPPPSG